MIKDDIIRMAREAGMEFRENADEFNTAYCDGVHRDELECFAALVAAAEREKWMERTAILIRGEREACAKVCEAMRPTEREFDQRFYTACTLNANAIRNRSKGD